MPLPPPTSPRQSLHRREITLCGYKRDDGLFDIEGHLYDVKDVDFNVASGLRKAGDPVHSMWLRITVDQTLNIVDAAAASDAMPYVGYCDTIAPDYRKLIGLAIRPGFSNRVRALLGGTSGCTHITELVGSLATTAFQTIAGQGVMKPDAKPYQLDRCHALRTDGPAVARYYPKWYRGDASHIVPSAEPDNH
jgi:hypothetical protein